MDGTEQESRRRLAQVLCLVGLGLVLAGGALLVQHYATLPTVQSPRPPADENQNYELARLIQRVLFWLLVLIVIFGVSTFAFLRWSRRFRHWVFHRPHPPTPSDDVWSMHRLPDEPPRQ